MKTPDEKLQESIEQGRYDSADLDSQAYKIVFEVIKKEPEIQIHPLFSDRIIGRIVMADEKRAVRRDFVWLGIGIFVLIVTAIVTIVLTGFQLKPGTFKFIGNYGGLLIFASFLIGVFHWVEKKILPHKSVI